MSAHHEFDGRFGTGVAKERQKDTLEMFERRTPPYVRPASDTKTHVSVGTQGGGKDGMCNEHRRTCCAHLNVVLSAPWTVGFEDDTLRTVFVALYRRIRQHSERPDGGEVLRLQTGFVAVRTDVLDYETFTAHSRESERRTHDLSTTLARRAVYVYCHGRST